MTVIETDLPWGLPKKFGNWMSKICKDLIMNTIEHAQDLGFTIQAFHYKQYVSKGCLSTVTIYVIELFRRARISPCALMMGILYAERLAQSNPNYLKKVSPSDLFMVSMVCFLGQKKKYVCFRFPDPT